MRNGNDEGADQETVDTGEGALHGGRCMTRCLFLIYAHKDRAWYDEIEPVLARQARAAGWDLWSDKLLPADLDPQDWDGAEAHIRPVLQRADAYVMLVSPHSLASSFIERIEAALMDEADAAYAREVFLIRLVPCDVAGHRIARFDLFHGAVFATLTPAERRAELARLAAMLPQLERQTA